LTGTVVVLDVGKTLTKLGCWSEDGALLAKLVRPNLRVMHDSLARLDVDGIGRFALASLSRFARHGPIAAIIPVAHGAAVAGIRGAALAFQPLDYEQAIPTNIAADYDRQRDAFAHNGSPCLPDGLNIGRQLHWLEARDSEALAETTLLPWAQYWSWWLSGAAASEVTSLGCHSDLWSPAQSDFSDLAHSRGWATRFAPFARAGDVVGTLRADLADAAGLSCEVAVHCGLHDSNAALLAARPIAEMDLRDATVVSTGTWFVAMRRPASPFPIAAMPRDRDCLVNVDIAGAAVPSARFMGGREIERLTDVDTPNIDAPEAQESLLGAIDAVLKQGAMILPGFAPGTGPFANCTGAWINRPVDPIERAAAIAIYAALVTDAMLELVGTRDLLILEGRFSGCALFAGALASLRPGLVVHSAAADCDVGSGALHLVRPAALRRAPLSRVSPIRADLSAYRRAWQSAISARPGPNFNEART
jgi:sugar (pentulose or hexulose) kinase